MKFNDVDFRKIYEECFDAGNNIRKFDVSFKKSDLVNQLLDAIMSAKDDDSIIDSLYSIKIKNQK